MTHPATTYTDNTAVNGTEYHYVVVAVDASGNPSAATDSASATPEDVVAPPAPGGRQRRPG